MIEEEPESLEEIGEALYSFTEKIGESKVFNFEKFSSQVEQMLAQSSPEDIEKLKDEEYDQLLSFILASNKGIDEFLREVEDSEK